MAFYLNMEGGASREEKPLQRRQGRGFGGNLGMVKQSSPPTREFEREKNENYSKNKRQEDPKKIIYY